MHALLEGPEFAWGLVALAQQIWLQV